MKCTLLNCNSKAEYGYVYNNKVFYCKKHYEMSIQDISTNKEDYYYLPKSNILNNQKKEEIMVKLNEEERKCCSCRWAEKITNKMAIGQSAAECRRFPPQIMLIQGHPVVAWPVVNNDPRLYCGEWKPKTEE